jgi:acetyl-CoA carboxylase carboxyl transferase subunit alpha
VVAEPLGGAHRAPETAIATVGAAVAEALDALAELSPDEMREQRAERFYAIGRMESEAAAAPRGREPR